MRRARTRGMTLLEIVVASAIVAFLALVIMSATVPLSTQSTSSAIAQDMDRTAARVLAMVRRDLRLTGYTEADAARFGKDAINDGDLSSSPPKMTFQRREDMNSNGWAGDDTDWSTNVVYERVAGSPSVFSGVPGTINRYRLVRTHNGLQTVLAEDVEDVTFTVADGDRYVIIILRLLRPDTTWRGGTDVPDPIRREYREQVEMMNRPSESDT